MNNTQWEEEGRARLERRAQVVGRVFTDELKYAVTLATLDGKKVHMTVGKDGATRLHSHYAHFPIVDNCVRDAMHARSHLWLPIDLSKIIHLLDDVQGFFFAEGIG